MAKKITLKDKTEVIADTMVCDIEFDRKVISTICKYCGTTIKVHEEEHYDYHDRDTWTTRDNYCPKQCDGVHAEYEQEKEIDEAIRTIKEKYYDRRQSTYDNSKVYFHATQQYMNEISKRHQKEMELVNNKVNHIFERNFEGAYIQVRKRDK